MVTQSIEVNRNFEAWHLRTSAQLRDLAGTLGERFRDETMIAHDRRIIDACLRLGDDDLARAASLHGVSDPAKVYDLPGMADSKANLILSDWHRLRMLDHADKEMPARLAQSVLPAMRDVRGAVLLVLEALDRLDPTGKIAKLSGCSHSGMVELPTAAEETRLPMWSSEVDEEAAFVAAVGAETARFLGLWPERNWCEDLGLYYRSRDRLFKILHFRDSAPVIFELGRRLEAVRAVLGGLPDVNVVWEWHHPATLDRKLGETPGDRWIHRLSALGMASVICPSRDTCYTALGQLHQCLPHQSLEILDQIGKLLVPSNQLDGIAQYEAIHTLVRLPEPEKEIRIRIITQSSQRRRHARLDAEHFAEIRHRQTVRSENGLRVFAFDGRSFLLPVGSTVLNFCHALYKRSITLATGALVNRQSVDLLQKLSDGDVVRVQMGSRPRELPSGWDKHVPPETVASIRRQFKRYFRPQRVTSGRTIFRQAVGELADLSGLDEPSFDGFIEDFLATQDTLPKDVHSFYRSCGTGFTGLLMAEIGRKFAAYLKNANRIELDMLTVPKELMHTFTEMRVCPHCTPGDGEALLGNVTDDGVLMIHSARRRKCIGKGAQPVAWHRDTFRGQYFVIEMNNRQGIAAEIISTVANKGIDLISHAGTTLGSGWAVLRLHVRSVLRDQSRDLVRELSTIKGVLRVLPPHAKPIPALEANLPPRELRRNLVPAVGSLYIAGPAIVDPDFFYGRTNEIDLLRELFSRVDVKGAAAFVKGPYRIGKTSLVNQFILENTRPEFSCDVLEHRVQRGTAWSAVAPELRAKAKELLKQSAPGLARRYDRLPVGALIARLPVLTGRKLILFIDEAVGLLQDSQTAGEEAQVLAFFSKVFEVPNLMLILAGPEAPTEDLASPSQGLLRRAEPVRLRGLEEDDVYKLLAAEKLNYRGVRMSVNKSTSTFVYRFTAGNPYWCNLLALAAIAGNKTCVLTDAHIDDAIPTLLADALAFNDRLVDLAWKYADQGADILDFLARTRRGVSATELFDLVKVMPRRDLDITLQRLQMRGSIRLDRQDKWHIECQALARRITAYHSKVAYV
jgi:hypothetical protein